MALHYQDERATIWHGDCLDVLRALPDNSVDAIVTDPPYDLTDGGQQDCASDVLRNAIIRDAANDEAASHERSVAFRILVPASTPPVQVGLINLDHEVSTGQEEVNRDRAVAEVDDVLVDDGDAVLDQQGERGEFRLWVREGEPRCVGTCRCLAHGGQTVLRIPVGLRYDPPGDAERPAGVVAFPRAELPAVLALDVRRNTAELLPARGADAVHPRFLLLPAKTVRARAAARRLAAMLEPALVGEVTAAADGTGSFHVRAHADLLRFARPILAQRGFMGRTWDGTGIAFDERMWAEVARVMKPGAHLLAFGGTRTYHHLTAAIERAGFEIRDSIGHAVPLLAWQYGSGFPKSLDVGKAIDKAAGAEREVVGRLNRAWRTQNRYSDPHSESMLLGKTGVFTTVTAPATPEAARWSGFGTALKPAWEPIVMARKPLAGTVARNVVTWGCGALNIDATRVSAAEPLVRPAIARSDNDVLGKGLGVGVQSEPAGRWPANVVLSHCSDPDGGDLCADGCVDGCPVAELDRQSGNQRDGVAVNRNRSGYRPHTVYGEARVPTEDVGYGGQGGASRYFPVFRYQAKAPASERPRVKAEGGDAGVGHVAHPT